MFGVEGKLGRTKKREGEIKGESEVEGRVEGRGKGGQHGREGGATSHGERQRGRE
jgi:hypothetical protein